MPNCIEATCRRIGAALAPHTGRHVRRTPRVRPYAPRVPHTPAPTPHPVPPQTDMVRPYVLDENHCARRRAGRREAEGARADRDRRGVAVLVDIAESAATHTPQAEHVLVAEVAS